MMVMVKRALKAGGETLRTDLQNCSIPSPMGLAWPGETSCILFIGNEKK